MPPKLGVVLRLLARVLLILAEMLDGDLMR